MTDATDADCPHRITIDAVSGISTRHYTTCETCGSPIILWARTEPRGCDRTAGLFDLPSGGSDD